MPNISAMPQPSGVRQTLPRGAGAASSGASSLAVEMAKDGVPFRDACRQAADPARWAEGDPAASLALRTSPGAAGNLRLSGLDERLAALRAG